MYKLLFVIALISGLDCLKDVCDKDCISDVILNKRNLSKESDHNITIVSAVFDSLFNSKRSHVIKDNISEYSDDLPHDFVPEISDYERDFIKVLSQNYLRLQQPFDLSHVPGVSAECRMHSKKFVESLKNFELWALKLHDASAKLQSGLLNGNVNNFGDFDHCLNVDAPNDEFQGKYCLAYLQPTVTKSLMFSNYLRRLMQSHGPFTSNFDDPGHRVPRYSTMNWAVCVPSSCSHNDVELSLKQFIENYTNGTGIDIEIRVAEEMCQEKNVHWLTSLDRGTQTAIASLLLLFLLLTTSTIYDYNITNADDKNEWLTSFSLIRNTKSLFSTTDSPSDIKTAHAIRFFNAVMLFISHKCMAILFNPYSNRTEMAETLGKPWTVVARAASLYTDPFLMLSGMLTAYALIGKLKKQGKFNLFKEFASRYLRIMPPLAFLIAFCTFILPMIGSGPQWNLVVTHHSDICKQYWWRNLLFIHNWFGFSNMCLTHTHHVGIDTELFSIAPFLIFALWKWPRKGMSVILGLATVSTIARYYVTYTYGLSNYVFFGTSVKQLFETADRMYINPPHRFTVYAMGIGLGYILRMFGNAKLTSSQLKVGWYLSTLSLMLAFFGPAPMGDIDYKFDATQAAHYAAFAPILWNIFFGWIIVVAQLGYKNKFIEFLEWRGFQVCTKLSYSFYLTQFPVFFYNVGRVRTAIHYSLINTFLDSNEIMAIVLVSIMLTLFVEFPCNNLKSLLLDGKKTARDKKQVENIKQKSF